MFDGDRTKEKFFIKIIKARLIFLTKHSVSAFQEAAGVFRSRLLLSGSYLRLAGDHLLLISIPKTGCRLSAFPSISRSSVSYATEIAAFNQLNFF
jgi:hypothetical protein